MSYSMRHLGNQGGRRGGGGGGRVLGFGSLIILKYAKLKCNQFPYDISPGVFQCRQDNYHVI